MKTKKLVAVLSLIIVVAMLATMIAACNPTDDGDEDSEIYAIYQLYRAAEEAKGNTPLSYEAWLASIKGEKGDKGDQGDPGAPGAAGSAFFTGEGAPEAELGKPGDMYLDTLTGDMYSKGANGWGSAIFNIKGATGPKGDKGDDGEDGEDGEDGAPGAMGRGIEYSTIHEDGHLWIVYTDGSAEDAGKVRNPSNLFVKYTYRGEVNGDYDLSFMCYNDYIPVGGTYKYVYSYDWEMDYGITLEGKPSAYKNGVKVEYDNWTDPYTFTADDTRVEIEYRWDDWKGTWLISNSSSREMGFLILDGQGNAKFDFNEKYMDNVYVDGEGWKDVEKDVPYEDVETTYTIGSSGKPVLTFNDVQYDLGYKPSSVSGGVFTELMSSKDPNYPYEYWKVDFYLYRLDQWFGSYDIQDEDGFNIGTLDINGKAMANAGWTRYSNSSPTLVSIEIGQKGEAGYISSSYSYNFDPAVSGKHFGIAVNFINQGSGGYRDSANDNPPSAPHGGIGIAQDGSLILYLGWANGAYGTTATYKLIKK